MNHPTGNFSQKIEWIILALMIILLLGLINLPYIVGYLNEDGMKFSGAAFDRPDYAVHLSALQSGLRGNWAYHPRFTSEQVPGVYIKLTYVILGNLCRLFKIPVDYSYQIARNVFFLVMCGVLYLTLALIFPQQITRLVAFWVVVCGSGFGWLQYIFSLIPNPNISPIDFWLMDGYILFGSMVFPHFSLSSISLIGIFGLLLALDQLGNRLWIGLLMTILVLVSIINQPFILILQEILIISGGLFLFLKRKIKKETLILGSALLTLIAGLGLGYNLYVLTAYPFWKIFTAQNVTLSPPISYYMWGYGGLWVVIIAGVALICLHRNSHGRENLLWQRNGLAVWLAIVWCVSGLFLSYLPIASQRRFMHAYTFPLGILAMMSALKFTEILTGLISASLRKRFLTYMTIFWVFLTTIGTVYISVGQAMVIQSKDNVYFDPKSLVAAVDWLRANAGEDDVVLASPQTSYLILERSGLRVYSGHFAETLDYRNKQEWVDDIFTGAVGWNDILDKNIQWVIIGPYELRMGVDTLPSPRNFGLRLIRDDVRIYRVLR